MKSYSREHFRARQEARQFGAPGLSRNNSANKKTGKFSGYWFSGRMQWQGAFANGVQTGLWAYYDKSGNFVQELHFNL
jgi:antitoxin component YwqK of YwqJK toxin-antitoxin module